jgi:hypothetical protein
MFPMWLNTDEIETCDVCDVVPPETKTKMGGPQRKVKGNLILSKSDRMKNSRLAATLASSFNIQNTTKTSQTTPPQRGRGGIPHTPGTLTMPRGEGEATQPWIIYGLNVTKKICGICPLILVLVAGNGKQW